MRREMTMTKYAPPPKNSAPPPGGRSIGMLPLVDSGCDGAQPTAATHVRLGAVSPERRWRAKALGRSGKSRVSTDQAHMSRIDSTPRTARSTCSRVL